MQQSLESLSWKYRETDTELHFLCYVRSSPIIPHVLNPFDQQVRAEIICFKWLLARTAIGTQKVTIQDRDVNPVLDGCLSGTIISLVTYL